MTDSVACLTYAETGAASMAQLRVYHSATRTRPVSEPGRPRTVFHLHPSRSIVLSPTHMWSRAWGSKGVPVSCLPTPEAKEKEIIMPPSLVTQYLA